LSIPPLYKPRKFFIGREFPKQEEFKDIELHDGGGLTMAKIEAYSQLITTVL